jgi:chaperonin GroES
MFQKFRPLGTHVWVERIEKDTKTAGGIYIPGSAQEDTQTGKVLAIGDAKHVQVGDTIFFAKFAGNKAGLKHLVLKEEDILGIIEE